MVHSDEMEVMAMVSLCPFCKSELTNSKTHCPNNKIYPCLECKKCRCYFYTKNNYNALKELAFEYHSKLNSRVFYFSTPQEKSQKKLKR